MNTTASVLNLSARSFWLTNALGLISVNHSTDTAILASMGTLHLHLHAHLVLWTSSLVELLCLIWILLLGLVFCSLINWLNSSSCFGSAHQTFLVKGLIQILNKWTSLLESIRVLLSTTSIGGSITRSLTSSTNPCLATTSIWLSPILTSIASCLTVTLILLLLNHLISRHRPNWLFTENAILLCSTVGNNRRLRNIYVLTLILLSLLFLNHPNLTRFITEAIGHQFWWHLLLVVHIHLVDRALLGTDSISVVLAAVLDIANWPIVRILDFASISWGRITQLGLILFVFLLDWGRMWI